MNHLRAEETLAQFAHQAQARAWRELLLLARIEIEEAKVQDFVAIAHPAHQRAPGSKLDGCALDLAFELHRLAAARIGEAYERGLVFVTQRKMQHEIELAAHAE